MAKSTEDTNDSQFFITDGIARHLDFNHSIFGLLTQGDHIRELITNVPVGAQGRPVTNVVMQQVDVITDQENGVLMLKAAEGATGQANITVTVRDDAGRMQQRTFHVTVTPDNRNGAPFLADIPLITTTVNTPAQFQLTAIDVEGDDVEFGTDHPDGSENVQSITVSPTGLVTVTPPNGFTGIMQVVVYINQVGGSDTQDQFDAQVVRIEVRPS
jgi:cyclophilin family peptidyl-prolyl cis-trans isomerase